MAIEPRKSAPTRHVFLQFGERGVEDVGDLAEHLRVAGFSVQVPETPSTDVHLLSITAEAVNTILVEVGLGILNSAIWEIGKWAVGKATRLKNEGSVTHLRVRINAEKENEVQFSVSNTGAWRLERLPSDEKPLLPAPSKQRETSKQKAKKAKKRRKN